MPETSDHLARHVERRRRDLGMSIGELEKVAKLSQPVVTDIRKGRVKSYNESTILAMSSALHWIDEWYDRLVAGESPTDSWDTRSHTELENARIPADYNSRIPRLSPEAQSVIDTIIEAEERKLDS